jgi:hypothetical protein
MTPAAVSVRAKLVAAGLGERIAGIFDPGIPSGDDVAGQWTDLAAAKPDMLVIADDRPKEELLRACAAQLQCQPPCEVVIAGTSHLDFHDAVYDDLDAPALVPSYASGYAFTRVHMYQCLRAAAANGLEGAVVEFGAFKGGTTAWLARTVRRLDLPSRVLAFDSWSGFPPRRSMLDLYEHSRCVFTDMGAVRAYLEPLGVEIVEGDISDTAVSLDMPILLAFVDTDNYSPARAAIEAVLPRLIVGGSIVFDHYATTGEYIYTLGERMAARELLGGSGLLQIHGTGVFVKIPSSSSSSGLQRSASES